MSSISFSVNPRFILMLSGLRRELKVLIVLWSASHLDENSYMILYDSSLSFSQCSMLSSSSELFSLSLDKSTASALFSNSNSPMILNTLSPPPPLLLMNSESLSFFFINVYYEIEFIYP